MDNDKISDLRFFLH